MQGLVIRSASDWIDREQRRMSAPTQSNILTRKLSHDG